MDYYEKMLKQFTQFWFKQSKYWFNQSNDFDACIKKYYGHYLEPMFIEVILDYIYSQPLETQNKYLYLGLILICDQLVRHCERNNTYVIENYTQKVVSLSKYISVTPKLWDLYSPEERCFILLPLRHSNKNAIENNKYVLETIRKLNEQHKTQIYERFIRATLLRYGKLKNACVEQSSITDTTENKEIISVLDDKSCQKVCFKNQIEEKEKIINALEQYIKKHKLTKFTISLSGGADSMVLCYGLKMLQRKYELDLKAVHIDYNNRETSQYEAKLCELWCSMLNIPIYVRKIDEIKRTRNKDRGLYEEITKEVRFNMYELLEYSVVLGHNKDDTYENILSNITKGRNYDNLFGMDEIYHERVTICRPFLQITKQEIYDFANKYEVPFVYDSTPKWSDRGKHRDILMPFLKNYDMRLVEGLNKVSAYVKDLSCLSEDYLNMLISYEIQEINKTTKQTQLLAKINEKVFNYDLNFWRLALMKVCKKYKLHYISEKSVQNSYKKIKDENKHNKIILNNRVTIVQRNINKVNYICIYLNM